VIRFFDEWTRCIGSGYQKDSVYRHGKFDSCTAQWNDLKTAMTAKTTSDPEEAQRLLAQTHYRKNLGSDLTQSPTAGVIWDLKEKPCWEEIREDHREACRMRFCYRRSELKEVGFKNIMCTNNTMRSWTPLPSKEITQ
jgi:hypothetical protein